MSGPARTAWPRWALSSALRYLPVFPVGWTAGALCTAPLEDGPYGPAFAELWRAMPGFAAVFGGGSLVLLLLCGRWRHGEQALFRPAAGMVACLPLFPLLFFSPLIVVVLSAAHLAYALTVMPAYGPGPGVLRALREGVAEAFPPAPPLRD
ncbi:hypothetical protein [Streptomyces sp. NPDC089799]|uniref:hypothetical protein n=1 Tax=Streptomyces sp. NPDC089799 TaxID=3155066 RepID=UPI00341E9A32